MNTKCYILITMLFFSSAFIVFGQSGMTIKPGGAVTVNGNTIINAPAFVCGTPMTDNRDGKTYSTVLIGTQCWFASNLHVGTKVLGSAEQTNNSIIEKYCYNDDDANCAVYGGLYQWAEMVQYLNGATNTTSWNPVPTSNVIGICPTGWHLPTDAEWTTLTTFLGGESAGGKMKETGTAHWLLPNTGATNSSGFTGLPGGSRDNNGYFLGLMYGAYFWSSSQVGPTGAWNRYLSDGSEYVDRVGSYRTDGFSVRCLKD